MNGCSVTGMRIMTSSILSMTLHTVRIPRQRVSPGCLRSGILDLNTGVLTAANGGHEKPIVKDTDGYYEAVADKHGFVVGSVPEIKYTEYELQLKPGSRLFLYSDGLVEASDSNDSMFGMERVLTELNRDHDVSAEKTIDNMKSAVADFVQDAEQFDDMTMLCMIYRGR